MGPIALRWCLEADHAKSEQVVLGAALAIAGCDSEGVGTTCSRWTPALALALTLTLTL